MASARIAAQADANFACRYILDAGVRLPGHDKLCAHFIAAQDRP
jgi:hypothetical protein